jgi:hypothetical protein
MQEIHKQVFIDFTLVTVKTDQTSLCLIIHFRSKYSTGIRHIIWTHADRRTWKMKTIIRLVEGFRNSSLSQN